MKEFPRSELGSVLLIGFGAILLLNPDFGSAALATVLGWVLVVIGAGGLLLGIIAKLRLIGMGGSIAALICGIWLLKNPLIPAKLLGIALGLLLAGQGLEALGDALSLRRCGGMFLPGLIFAGVMLVLGLALVFSPLATSRFVMTVAGIVMVLCGVGNLISHNRATKYIRDHSDDKIIDAEE